MNPPTASIYLWGWLLLCVLMFLLGLVAPITRGYAIIALLALVGLFGVWAWKSGWGGAAAGNYSTVQVQLDPAVTPDGRSQPVTPESLAKTARTLKKRLESLEKDVSAEPSGSNGILVRIPSTNPDELLEASNRILQVAHLEFRLVHPNSRGALEQAKSTGAVIVGWVELPYKEYADRPDLPHTILVKPRADFDGSYVTDAYAYLDSLKGWAISLEFDGEGKKLFGKLTTDNVHRQLAIVVDNVVISAPMLNEPIVGGRAEISGQFKPKDARALALGLLNPLSHPVKITEIKSFSPPAGAATPFQSVCTGLAGFALCAGLGLIRLFQPAAPVTV